MNKENIKEATNVQQWEKIKLLIFMDDIKIFVKNEKK